MSESDLHISTRLAAVLPPLDEEARKKLAANIEADGRVIDPILYWHDGKRNVVLDGMHRWKIIRQKGKTAPRFRTELVSTITTYEEAEAWIWDHQAGRRNLTRAVIGKWYNRIKATKGGDKRSTKGTNVTLVDAAEKIADSAGVSPRTVKRDGARAAALDKCTPAVQKGIGTGKLKASDAEIKTLAKLKPADQNEVAGDVRSGRVGSVKEAIEQRNIPTPGKKKPTKPPRKPDRSGYLKQWTQAIGPLVRLVDKIADGVGEKGGKSHKTVLEYLDVATEEMQEWTGEK